MTNTNSIFQDLPDSSQQQNLWLLRLQMSGFEDISTSNWHEFLKCCNSRNSSGITNALSSIMVNDLKFTSIY